MNVCPKLVVRRVRKGSESVEKLDKFYSKISYLREIAIKNENVHESYGSKNIMTGHNVS